MGKDRYFLAAMIALALSAIPTTSDAGVDTLDIQQQLSMPGVKLVVVEFYATWCKPCMEAVPKWKALHKEYGPKGLRFIVISGEGGKDVCSKPPDWSPDVSICDNDGMIQNDFGVKQLPQSFLYSWEGNIAMTSHYVEPIEEAIKRYYKDTNLKIVISPPDVIGDKYAVSSNPIWVRDFIIEKIRASSKFDVVKSSNYAISASKSDVCEKGFPPNSVLRSTLQGDDRGNRNLTLSLEKEGCVIASATEKYFGKGMNEDIDSMKTAVSSAVWKIITMVVQPKVAKMVDEGDEWFQTTQERVIVQFESNPAGATLLVDGLVKCKETPCSVMIPKGTHEVSMQLERYLPEKQVVSLEKDKTIRWEIKPNFGWLNVYTEPSGLNIEIDDKPVGRSPIKKLILSPAPHKLSVKSPCYFMKEESFVLNKGETKELEFSLKPREGAIDVTIEDENGNPARAGVSIDGVKIGTAPGTFKINVCAKKIEISNGKESWSGSLDVREKQTDNIHAKMKPIWIKVGNEKGSIGGPIMAASGVIVGGLGGLFTYLATSSANDAHYAKNSNSMQEAKDRVGVYNGLAITSYVTGGGLLIGGIIWWILNPPGDKKKKATVSIIPQINEQDFMLHASGEW